MRSDRAVPLARDGLRRFRQGLTSRLLAAPLPAATGSVSAGLGTGLAHAGLEILALDPAAALPGGPGGLAGLSGLAGGIALCLASLGWFGAAILCGADGWSRWRDYQRFKQLLARRGARPRVLRPAAGSRCQRDAAMQAARELGLATEVRAYFRALGYRWHHLLPDRVLEQPGFVLTAAFLRSTFLGWRKHGQGRP